MRLAFIILTLVITASCIADTGSTRVLMMVSEGFYAPEYYVPLEAFKEAGFEVSTATKYKRPTKPDERQLHTHAAVDGDITFDQIDVSNFDAIVFAGGNGAWEDFFPNNDVHKALVDFMNSNKVVALLCSSTGLLGVTNNLSGTGEPIAVGRNVTGYKRVKGLMVQLGRVNYTAGIEGQPYVVVDGNLITGRDPKASELFAKTIVNKLK